MKNNTRKILLALLLVFTMLMSLVTVSSFAAEAGESETVTVYFQNNWLWTDVTCYYWGSTTGTNPQWPGEAMTLAGTQDDYEVYSMDIPADVEGLIINGIKNDGSGNRDQTPDIKTGIVDGAGWKMNWSNGNQAVEFTYNPNQAPTETTYTVAGTSSLCGSEWDPADATNDLSLGEDGTYSITYTNVAAGEHKFKVVKNHSWAKAWPSSDYVLTLAEASDVTISFNPATETVNVVKVPTGGSVDPTPDPDPDPTPATNDYYLVGWINGVDVSDQSYKFVDGKISINLTGDAYVAVMDANGVWYMTDGWLGTEISSATLLNSATATLTGNQWDKFFVKGGQATISITENENGTISISSGAGMGTVTPSTPAENPIEAENGYYKIYVYNTAWWDMVCYYVWNDAGEVRQEWPGQEVSESDYLLYQVMIPAEYAYVIFNNSGDIQTADIAMISIDKSKTVYNNGTGEWMSIEEYDPNLQIEKPEPPAAPDYSEYDTVRVYLGNSLGWDSAYFYTWNNEIGDYAAWPGTLMDFDDVTGMYYADVPVCFDRIIFNNGSAQTLDLFVPAIGDDKVVCDIAKVVGAAGGGVDGSECWVAIEDFEIPDPILPPSDDVIVVVKNDAGWENVFIYYWDGDSTIEWPGTAMEQGANGYYYALVPAGTLHVLFHNGGSWEDGSLVQSADLYVPTDDNVLFNNADGSWSYYDVDDANQPGDSDNTPDDPTDDPTDEPVKELNFFEKLWLAIINFFKKLFGLA